MCSGVRDLLRSSFCFVVFLAITFEARSQTSVWIDTDPAMGMFLKDYDDSLGLAYALKSPRIRIEGISISFGNGTVSQSLPVARSIVEQFGSDPKTQKGLIFPGAGSRDFVGLATESTVALQLALNKKRLVYVALGPLTNLATLLQIRPALAKNIDQIIWVAGRPNGASLKIGTSNPYSFHDSNFEKDPYSASVVLNAKIPVTLISKELAQDFLLTRDDQKAISESGKAGKWLAKQVDHWLTLWKTGWNIEGAPILDVLPFIAVTQPATLQGEPGFAALSMDLNKVVPPEVDENGKYLLVSPKQSTNQSRPVTYIRNIDFSAKENWLKVMTGK